MKLATNNYDFDSLPLLNRLFLALWKFRKGYGSSKEFTFGQVAELSFAVTNDLKFDTPSERTTFNNSLQYDEFMLSWDGVQPIDILFYELNKKLKRRILSYMVSQVNRSD